MKNACTLPKLIALVPTPDDVLDSRIERRLGKTCELIGQQVKYMRRTLYVELTHEEANSDQRLEVLRARKDHCKTAP